MRLNVNATLTNDDRKILTAIITQTVYSYLSKVFKFLNGIIFCTLPIKHSPLDVGTSINYVF